MQDHARSPKPPAVLSPAPNESLRRVSSLELLGDRGEMVIEHQGRDYRLRVTQNGKLILTA